MMRTLSASIVVWGLCGAPSALAQVKLEFKYAPNTQSSGIEHIVSFEQQAGAFPDTPVNKGDTWKRTEDWHIEGGQTLSFDRTYEYVGTEDKDGRPVDKIKVTDEAVRYQLGSNTVNLSVKESDLKIESSEGTLLFDRELGAILERTITSRITGKLTFLLGGQELPAELDLKITRDTQQKQHQ